MFNALRPLTTGSLSFFDDSTAHGLAFAENVTNLEVLDVPGNHYTLLHQDDDDMGPLLEHMQKSLSSHGVGEMAKVRDRDAYRAQ